MILVNNCSFTTNIMKNIIPQKVRDESKIIQKKVINYFDQSKIFIKKYNVNPVVSWSDFSNNMTIKYNKNHGNSEELFVDLLKYNKFSLIFLIFISVLKSGIVKITSGLIASKIKDYITNITQDQQKKFNMQNQITIYYYINNIVEFILILLTCFISDLLFNDLYNILQNYFMKNFVINFNTIILKLINKADYISYNNKSPNNFVKDLQKIEINFNIFFYNFFRFLDNILNFIFAINGIRNDVNLFCCTIIYFIINIITCYFFFKQDKIVKINKKDTQINILIQQFLKNIPINNIYHNSKKKYINNKQSKLKKLLDKNKKIEIKYYISFNLFNKFFYLIIIYLIIKKTLNLCQYNESMLNNAENVNDYKMSVVPLFMVINNGLIPIINCFKNSSGSLKMIKSTLKNFKLQSRKSNEYKNLNLNGDIEFKKVSYKNVIDKIDLTIKGGQRTLIQGASGGGKSTIIKLLAPVIDPNKGRIIIKDKNNKSIDIKKAHKKDIMNNIAMIFQDSYIYDDTIENNITLGKDVPLNLLHKAIEESKLTDFISNKKEGYKFKIINNGFNLSGGQKQRILLARCLLDIYLYDKPIILLDEVEQQIDDKTSSFIMNNILTNHKGKTIIVISHNPKQFIHNIDNIISIEDGKIISNQKNH